MSLSRTSMAMLVCPGTVEAPRGDGARAAGEEEEVASHPAPAGTISRLSALSGPEAQEEVRVRALRRAHILSALQEMTEGVSGALALWSEISGIERVSATAPGS